MAKGKVNGPLGPIMFALLLAIAGLMMILMKSPDLAEKFSRPEDFYDNTFEQAGIALLFAGAVSGIVALISRLKK